MSLLSAAKQLRERARGKSAGRLARGAFERAWGAVTIGLTTAYYRAKYRRVVFGHGVAIRGRLIVRGSGTVSLGDYCFLDTAGGLPNKIQTFSPEAQVVIGDHCFLNSVEIACRERVQIGRRAMIGECLLMDTDFHRVEINRWDPAIAVRNKPITIEENVWIANRTIVLKGVTVGQNSVVGAGTVVRQSVPANVVVIGNPQQVVKHLDTAVLPYEPGG